jgi:hypothetical protein
VRFWTLACGFASFTGAFLASGFGAGLGAAFGAFLTSGFLTIFFVETSSSLSLSDPLLESESDPELAFAFFTV